MTNSTNELFVMIRDYLTVYLPNQRRASSHTVDACRTSLNQFLDYIKTTKKKQLIEIEFSDFNRDELVGYLDYLSETRGLAASTRNLRLACIRGFMTYCSQRRPELLIYMNGLATIPLQNSMMNTIVEYIKPAGIRALLAAPDTTKQRGLRDQFLMILMYDTGARVQEILQLRVADIRIGSTPTATLLGKGPKIRTVPLMKKTVEHFHHYISVFHPDASELSNDPLFYVERDGHKRPMSDDNVRRFLNSYACKAHQSCSEVPEKIHPHMFRHSRAMHLYQAGMDLTLVSQWLGHASLESTLIYAHADTEQKRRAIEKANVDVLIEKNNVVTEESMDPDFILRHSSGLL